MNDIRGYFEQLMQKRKVVVEKHHSSLIDGFVNDEAIISAFNSIKNTQQAMIDKWKEKTQIEDIKSKQIVLTNGTVGRQYEFALDVTQVSDIIGDYYLSSSEETGLDLNKEESKISGIPKVAGEFVLILNFKLKSETKDSPFHEKEIKLFINNDPKSLWKNAPTPSDIEYYKPDNDSTHFEFGSKQLVIGSKRGRSHAHEGKPRDDAFDFNYNEETGWGIIAVADGAGSAKYSRKGSEIACETVVDFFKNIEKEKLNEIDTAIANLLVDDSEENQKRLSGLFIEQLGKAAFSAQQKIRVEAVGKNSEIRDYSTTLIFALIKKYEHKYMIASFWVGDGGIGIYDKDKNEVYVLGTPDSGEFAGQTRFLTMSEIFSDGAYANRVRFKIVDDFTALILMTDGITDPKFQTDANLNKIEKWNDLWKDLSEENEDNSIIDFTKPTGEIEIDLMNWLDFWSPGNHDDRTIAILY